MRALLPLISFLILAGCGGSGGGGSTPPLDWAQTGLVTFQPSVSDRYMPGLPAGKSIWFDGHGALLGLKLQQTATAKVINGVPAKEIRSSYYNAVGDKFQESRLTYAVTADNKVYVIASNGVPSTLSTFIQPLMETLSPKDGTTYTDGYGDEVLTSYPYLPYYNDTLVCIGLLGDTSSFSYSLDKGFYVEVLFYASGASSTSTWAWDGNAPATTVSAPTQTELVAPESNG